MIRSRVNAETSNTVVYYYYRVRAIDTCHYRKQCLFFMCTYCDNYEIPKSLIPMSCVLHHIVHDS